jgi:hypothetical protein
VHLTGFAAVVSVHITILSAPVKHASLTEAVPSLSVALPVHGAPEDIEKPPIGPHELIVVGGTGGCGATCKHPVAINPPTTSAAIINRENAKVLRGAYIGTIPRIRPPPSVRLHDERFNPASMFNCIGPRQSCRVCLSAPKYARNRTRDCVLPKRAAALVAR